jgi:hypothetical protein
MSSSESEDNSFANVEKMLASKKRHNYRAKKKSEIEQFKKYEQLDKKKVFRAQNNVIMDQFTNETVISLNIFLSFFILI